MAGVGKGMILGAGGALGLCSQTESLSDIPRSLLRTALNGYDRVSVNHSPSKSGVNSQPDASISTSSEIAGIAAEIRDLKLNALKRERIVVYGNGGSGSTTLYAVGVIAATGAAVAWYKGYSLGDLVYVTKSTFNSAMEVLEEKFEIVYDSLDHVKSELMKRIVEVEHTVNTRASTLEERIKESGQIVEAKVDKLDRRLVDLDSGVNMLDSKVGENSLLVKRVGRGVELLVTSVLSIDNVGNNNKDELKRYLKDSNNSNNFSFFGERRIEDDKSFSRTVSAKRRAPLKGLLSGLLASTDGEQTEQKEFEGSSQIQAN